ncbi:ATP-dependent DNA helicase RecG [Patescibacteria group bacterium]|nr:ATP-dependent DNA helicase RecG [Patescibacteria group bacterium]
MNYPVNESVRIIPGVGEVAQSALERLGITSMKDLLNWFPRAYLDASRPQPIRSLPYGQLAAVHGTVDQVETRRSRSRGVPMLEAVVRDEAGSVMRLRWFNQSFLKQKLKPGTKWIFIGVANRFQGETQMLSPLIEEVPRILSVYGQTKGVTSKMMRGYLDWALRRVDLAESLPPALVERNGLLSKAEAWHGIHQPMKMADVQSARHRLAFEEVFWFFIRMALGREERQQEGGIVISAPLDVLREAVAGLPFELTAGQKRAIWDSVQDMRSGRPMTRLLNGDVGSGKTVVAAVLAAVVAKAGHQSVLLVPTEILAKQHAQSIDALLSRLGCRVAIWTAAQKDGLEGADIIIGTQAVLQEAFSLPRLAFVVIDEQHRFGVRQRQVLRRQSTQAPHILSMTATPIPRTLALALYGDLQVSFLRDKPKDRLPVMTYLVRPGQKAVVHQRIVTEQAAGHQVFIICPLIEEKERKEAGGASAEPALFEILDEVEQGNRERKTVLREVERLRKEHPEYGVIEPIHGKMKAEEKRAVMDRMAKGEVQVLVATSVIEVGVDVPGATVMVIEGAERFGLAQLHQFRGRVGRSSYQSYCFLCPTLMAPAISGRLQVLVDHGSGFEVAEADLALRGPGELGGSIQSGLPDFRMASLTDLSFLQEVKEKAEAALSEHFEFFKNHPEATYSKNTGGLE